MPAEVLEGAASAPPQQPRFQAPAASRAVILLAALRFAVAAAIAVRCRAIAGGLRQLLGGAVLLACSLAPGGAAGGAVGQGLTEAPGDARRSGLHDMSPATQALQRDDSLNPAFLWLQDGAERFARDCTGCHDRDSLRGAAARHPAFDDRLGKPVSLSGRIQQCQQRHVRGAPLEAESDALLGLEAFVAHRSRGLPLQPPSDPRLLPWRAAGEALWRQRIGQLDLSCAQCHDDHAGRRLAGSTIPQGHPTAYPVYRLEWQTLGSLQRRLRHCQRGVRAEPDAFGSDALVALELFLMQRAAGMTVETPGVRP